MLHYGHDIGRDSLVVLLFARVNISRYFRLMMPSFAYHIIMNGLWNSDASGCLARARHANELFVSDISHA